jgi:hydroxyacylglutathione hydrolase
VQDTVSDALVELVDEGLGNTCYLLDAGGGRALVVDPPRDLRAVHAAAHRRGLRIAWVADTHLHADFVSGARQLAAEVGAAVLASAAGRRAFDHIGLGDGDELDLGGLRLQALATPGHTGEHLAFLLSDGDRPVGVFTGGSLLVGSAARTDLVDPDRTVELARAQFHSLRRLLTLPDQVAVWPTHGAGSFCASPTDAPRTSTVGRERATNPLLREADEEVFVGRLLAVLGSYPPYFNRLAEVNRLGPTVLAGQPALRPLSAAEVRRRVRDGAVLIDARPITRFGAGHIPGAVSIALRPQFGTWLGWLVPAGAPLVFVRDDDQDPADIAWQALQVGYETLAGELGGGMPAWVADSPDLATIPVLDPPAAAGELATLSAVDVRQRDEYTGGRLPGAVHIELGALTDPGLAGAVAAGRPTLLMCGHGERAMTAASLLARTGRRVSVLAGEPAALAAAARRPLAAGE